MKSGTKKESGDPIVASRWVDALPVPAFATDGKGRITYWNADLEELTGRSASDVMGKKAWSAFFEEKRVTPAELALRSEEEEREEGFVVQNGSSHEVLFTARPVTDDEDELTGVIATLTSSGSRGAEGQHALRDLEKLPTPVMRIDKEFTVAFINEAGAAVAGMKPYDAMGKKCYELFKTPHCNTPECRCAQAMERDGVFEGETVADPEGRNIPIRYTGSPVKDEKGEVTGALEYVVDISATKSAIDNANSKVDYLNSIPTPVMVIDKSYTITFVNPAGAGVAGKTPEKVIGTKCYDLFKTPHCRTGECRCAQAMESGEVRTGETICDPSGVNLPIQYSGVPIRDQAGQVIGAVEYVVDMTETKRAMNEARLKEEYLNAVPTPVMVIDPDMTVQYMNPAGAAALGETQESVLGKKCFDLFNTTHCRTPECRCDQAMRNKKVCSGETEAKLGGGALPIDYTGAPLYDKAGNIIGALEYVLDISDRKAVLKDIIALAQSMARGDLGARAQGEYSGDFLAVAENLNRGLDAQQIVLQDITVVAESLANADLTAKATGDYQGDFATIVDNLNRAVDAQHQALVQVAEAVDQVAAASDQIASSSQSVAQGASEQASSLEETSSSLEELSSMTKQNADNAQAANGLAQTARGAADKGSGAMSKMMEAMTKIRASAENTGNIIRDINDIAFQTNLLALNAAVEAARAGDAGRGFAVVAEEVRNLAQRSKEAALKTEELIKESVNLTESGEGMSKDVNSNLTEIVDSVGKVGDIIGEIAVASKEQARGIEGINEAVAQMDQVTQQNAANSEESSSASQELSRQSQELASVVGQFHLQRRRVSLVKTGSFGTVHPRLPQGNGRGNGRSNGSNGRGRGNGASNGRSSLGPRTIELDPDEILPMEDDADFSQF